MKKILAEILVLIMLMSLIPTVFAEEGEAAAEITVEPTAEASVTVAPTAEVEEDDQLVSVIEDEKDAKRSVSIYASYQGDYVSYGDTITLKAVLKGYEGTSYRLQWQVSKDGSSWKNVSGEIGLTYSIVVSEDNANNCYRIAVTTED